MDKQKGAGPPRTTNTEENAKLAEESICSQEEGPRYPFSSKLKYAIMLLIDSRDSHLTLFVSIILWSTKTFFPFKTGLTVNDWLGI